MVEPIASQNLDTQYSAPRASTSPDGSELYVNLVAGEEVPLSEGKINLLLDGVSASFPMTVFADSVEDGFTWTPGDKLCLVGNDSGCLVGSGQSAHIEIVAGETLIWQGIWSLNPWAIENGVLQANCAGPVSVLVLGTSITYGLGGPDIPIRVDLDEGDGFGALFGDNPVSGGEEHNIDWSQVGTTYRVQGRADYLNFHASYASGGDGHVIALLDGDEVPDIPSYGNQATIESFLAPYIDVQSGTVVLDPSEAILLFEFTSNLASSAADWQDLVVLFDFQGGLCDA